MDQEASRMAVAVVPPKRVWYRPSRVPRMHTWPDHQNARRRGQGTRRGREGKAEEVREPGSGSVNETLSDHKPTIDDTSEQLYHAWTTCCRHPSTTGPDGTDVGDHTGHTERRHPALQDAAPAQELPSAGPSAGRRGIVQPARQSRTHYDGAPCCRPAHGQASLPSQECKACNCESSKKSRQRRSHADV
jgi:hypothetical protein